MNTAYQISDSRPARPARQFSSSPASAFESPSALVLLIQAQLLAAAADNLLDRPSTPRAGTVYQLGDFLLGDADCPGLYGHPGIRY